MPFLPLSKMEIKMHYLSLRFSGTHTAGGTDARKKEYNIYNDYNNNNTPASKTERAHFCFE